MLRVEIRGVTLGAHQDGLQVPDEESKGSQMESDVRF
jgi:hypothetical protein